MLKQSPMFYRLQFSMFLGISTILGVMPARATPLSDSLASGHFDILYVCPAAWRQEVARLAIYRATPIGGALTSVIAPTESLAVSHGPGRLGIQSAIQYAIQHWTPPPRYVVLVGAYSVWASSFYVENATDSSHAIIPTWFIADPSLVPTDWLFGLPPLVATDDNYVTSASPENSGLALALGRIPVWDLQSLSQYITKVTNYESQGHATWKGRALHIVEDRDIDGNAATLCRLRADSLAAFPIAGMESYFVRSLLYHSTAPPVRTWPVLNVWNAGVGFVLATGTGADPRSFAYLKQVSECSSPMAQALGQCTDGSSTPCDTLVATQKTPVVLAITCAAGMVSSPQFTHGPWEPPKSQCGFIAQYMLAVPNKGAVCVIGPTCAVRETPAYTFAREWMKATFPASTTIRVGDSYLQAKRRASQLVPNQLTEVRAMALLGDPCLLMDVGFQPVVGAEGGLVPLPTQLAISSPTVPAKRLEFVLTSPAAGAYAVLILDITGRVIERAISVSARAGDAVAVRVANRNVSPGVYFAIATGNGATAVGRTVVIR